MSKARDGVEDLKTIDANLAAKAPIASPSFTGNVGIGATSPSTSLHLKDNATGANTKLTVERSALSYTGEYAASHCGTVTNNEFDIHTNNTMRMRINSAGIVTKPFQPMVSMSRSDSALSIGSGVNLFATTSITTWVLQGITHNTSNGRFTLPVTGKYRVSFYSIKEAGVQAYFDLKKNGNLYGMRIYMNTNTSGGWSQYSSSAIYSYSANDYLTVVCNQGGTNNAHGGEHMNFSIELIG